MVRNFCIDMNSFMRAGISEPISHKEDLEGFLGTGFDEHLPIFETEFHQFLRTKKSCESSNELRGISLSKAENHQFILPGPHIFQVNLNRRAGLAEPC